MTPPLTAAPAARDNDPVPFSGAPTVPDKRHHRGPHPQDTLLFADANVPALRRAVEDTSLLLSRGYADTASLKLVCDHFALAKRQRVAVMRAACPDDARDLRRRKELTPADLRGARLDLDGYNVLTTVEAALAGGVILACRDGTFRDVAAMHGTYRKVEETLPALDLIGRRLAELGVAECTWYLDRPVSNSGRLRRLMQDEAERRRWPWRIELADSPDRLIAAADGPVVTSDSVILDRCRLWFNLARDVVTRSVPRAWLVDLSSP